MPGPVSQVLQFDSHATNGLVTDGLEGLRAMGSHYDLNCVSYPCSFRTSIQCAETNIILHAEMRVLEHRAQLPRSSPESSRKLGS